MQVALIAGLKPSKGAAPVLQDGGAGVGVEQNREDSGITSTTRRMTFDKVTGPTLLHIWLHSCSTPATTLAYVTVNAATTGEAEAFLSAPTSQDQLTRRYTVKDFTEGARELWLAFDSPVEHLDYKLNAADANAVLVVEAW